MKHAIALFITLACVMILVSCASSSEQGSAPSWYVDVYDQQYPEGEYLLAVGTGTGRNPAIDDATYALASAFVTNVSGQSISGTSDIILNRNGSTSSHSASSYESMVTTTSNLDNIVGLEVFDVVQAEDGTFYARVGLEVASAVQSLSTMLADCRATVESALSEARRAGTVDGLSILSSVMESANEADGYSLQLSVLTGSRYQSLSSQVENLRKNLLDGVSVSIATTVRGDVDASTVEGAARSAFSKAGISISDRSPVKAEVEVSSSRDDGNRSGYVIDNVVVSLSIDDGRRSATASAEDSITSIDEAQADRNVGEFISEALDELTSSLLAY